MTVKQGDLSLLQHPASQELLHSKIPARLAYVWTDGTPRVVPIWFHWNGREIVMGTPPKAPKLKALARNPKVSLTIDDNDFPHKVLLIRGTRTPGNRGWDCAGVCRGRRTLLRARRERGLDGPASHPRLNHGADFDHAGMGRASRFSNPLSQRHLSIKHVGPDALVRAGERSSPQGLVFVPAQAFARFRFAHLCQR